MMMMMMMTGCWLRKMIDVNSDGGTPLGTMSEQECSQYCLDRYPTCRSVDYRRSDGSCYWHNVASGAQWNRCCNRFTTYCARTSSLSLSLSLSVLSFTFGTGTCTCICMLYTAVVTTTIRLRPGPVRARGCKNGPAPFPGRMSYKATKPGLSLSVVS